MRRPVFEMRVLCSLVLMTLAFGARAFLSPVFHHKTTPRFASGIQPVYPVDLQR